MTIKALAGSLLLLAIRGLNGYSSHAWTIINKFDKKI